MENLTDKLKKTKITQYRSPFNLRSKSRVTLSSTSSSSSTITNNDKIFVTTSTSSIATTKNDQQTTSSSSSSSSSATITNDHLDNSSIQIESNSSASINTSIDVSNINTTASSTINLNEMLEEVYDENIYDDDVIDDHIVEQETENFNNNQELTLTQTIRNKPKLCHNGYHYTIDRDGRFDKAGKLVDVLNNIEWKCEITGNKKEAKCTGRVKSKGLWHPLQIIKIHNHEANPERTECLIATNKAKQLAIETSEYPRTIINKVHSKISVEAAVEMIRPHNLRQVINRARNEFVGKGNYLTRESINIPHELLSTIDSNMVFLWDDSGSEDSLRIIIFASTLNVYV